MKKDEFMKKLESQLRKMNKEDREEILSDYEEHFKEGKRKKRSEQAIAKALGDPKDIVKQLKAEHLVKKAEVKSSFANITRAVFASISLGFLNLIIVLGPFIAIVAVIISLFATGAALALSGLALFFASIVGFIIPAINLPAGMLVGSIFAGIGLSAMGVLMVIGMFYLTKLFFKGVIKYLRFNMKIINIKGDEE